MPDRPEDVDAAFAEIVAGLERDGVGRRAPDLDDPPAAEEEEPAPARPSGPPPTPWRGAQTEWDGSWGEDEHYHPPEPPPLPRLRPLTIVALGLVVVALVLLIVPGLIGLSARVATPIALIALTCGGAMLLLRVRRNPRPAEDGRDDGAQI